MTPMQFQGVMGCSQMNADLWYGPFTDAMVEFNIGSFLEQAAFLAQVGHECASLKKFEENMNYGPQAMMASWPNRFPDIRSCTGASYNPEKLANLVYSGRFGNGVIESGDGWKYRGRGPIQITFADTYKACGVALGLPLLDKPELLLSQVAGARSACWFWEDYKRCKSLPNLRDVAAVTRRIQGADNGLNDRAARFQTACKILGVTNQ